MFQDLYLKIRIERSVCTKRNEGFWEFLPPIAIRVQRRVDHLLAEGAALRDGGLVVLGLGAHQGPPTSTRSSSLRGVHLSCGQYLVWTAEHGTKQREIAFIQPT